MVASTTVTQEQRGKWFSDYQPLALNIAASFWSSYSVVHGEEDYRQVALMGLWKAACTYDGVTGTFSGYAGLVVRRECGKLTQDERRRSQRGNHTRQLQWPANEAGKLMEFADRREVIPMVDYRDAYKVVRNGVKPSFVAAVEREMRGELPPATIGRKSQQKLRSAGVCAMRQNYLKLIEETRVG